MIMTDKLANSLMDTLRCVAISALGGYPKDGLDLQTQQIVEGYAQKKFCELLVDWEDITEEEWEIIETE